MTSQHKEMRKTLKGPDRYQEWFAQAVVWLERNTKTIVMVIVPIFAMIMIGIGWKSWRAHVADERIAELASIDTLFDKEQRVVDDQRREMEQEIQKLTPTPPVLPEGVKMPPAASPPLDAAGLAKKADIEAKMKELKADHAASQKQYEQFFAKHEGTVESTAAGLRLGGIYLAEKNLAEARKVVERVLKHTAGHQFYDVQARLTYVGILEDLNDLDTAAGQVEKLKKAAIGDMQPIALLTIGRLYALRNAKDEARSTFQEIIDKHGSSREAERARGLLAILE